MLLVRWQEGYLAHKNTIIIPEKFFPGTSQVKSSSL